MSKELGDEAIFFVSCKVNLEKTKYSFPSLIA